VRAPAAPRQPGGSRRFSRNARLSMLVLRSIEDCLNGHRVPVSGRCKRAEAEEKDLQKSEGERGSRGARRYGRRNATFRVTPQAARSRSSPRANASCVKSSVAGGSSARGPADTGESQADNLPRNRPRLQVAPERSGACFSRGRSFLIVSSTDLRNPTPDRPPRNAVPLLGIRAPGSWAAPSLSRGRRGGVAIQQHVKRTGTFSGSRWNSQSVEDTIKKLLPRAEARAGALRSDLKSGTISG